MITSEAWGAGVEWNASSRTVAITSPRRQAVGQVAPLRVSSPQKTLVTGRAHNR